MGEGVGGDSTRLLQNKPSQFEFTVTPHTHSRADVQFWFPPSPSWPYVKTFTMHIVDKIMIDA